MTDNQTTPPLEPTPGTDPRSGSSSVPPQGAGGGHDVFSAAVPSAPAAGSSVPPLPASPAPATDPVLDEGTYHLVRTPRASGALALDGVWHQISPRYVVSQFVQEGIFLLLVIAAALVGVFLLEQDWVWIPGGILVLVLLITIVILPRQAKAIGYMLRADDIVFRKGILWQRMIAVPYGRMQLVDITQGPLDRAFGISQLKMVTAAATTGVQIPGLTQKAAEALRDTLIAVAETRRTGL